jgi:hypothetical protein
MVSVLGESQLSRGYMVATVSQHGVCGSGGPAPAGAAQESRRKAGQQERTHRGEHGVKARPVKNLRNAGDPKSGTAGL